jgi:predicted naringenin-chalcone synthase
MHAFNLMQQLLLFNLLIIIYLCSTLALPETRYSATAASSVQPADGAAAAVISANRKLHKVVGESHLQL